MKHARLTLTILIVAVAFPAVPASALFGPPSRWGQGERRGLCRQSIMLVGVEDDMDDRIRSIVRSAHEAAARRSPGQGETARAYEEALDDTLRDTKEPLLDRLLDSCEETFTVSELRGINNFYMSPAGQAWLRKGRTSIMPTMESAIAEIQPQIRDEVERRYCDRVGC